MIWLWSSSVASDSLSYKVTLNPPSISLPHLNFIVWFKEMVLVNSSIYELFPLSFLQVKHILSHSSLKFNFSPPNLPPYSRPHILYPHHTLPIITFTDSLTQSQSTYVHIVILTSRNTKLKLRWIQCYRRAWFVLAPTHACHLFSWLESTMEPGDSV